MEEANLFPSTSPKVVMAVRLSAELLDLLSNGSAQMTVNFGNNILNVDGKEHKFTTQEGSSNVEQCLSQEGDVFTEIGPVRKRIYVTQETLRSEDKQKVRKSTKGAELLKKQHTTVLVGTPNDKKGIVRKVGAKPASTTKPPAPKRLITATKEIKVDRPLKKTVVLPPAPPEEPNPPTKAADAPKPNTTQQSITQPPSSHAPSNNSETKPPLTITKPPISTDPDKVISLTSPTAVNSLTSPGGSSPPFKPDPAPSKFDNFDNIGGSTSAAMDIDFEAGFGPPIPPPSAPPAPTPPPAQPKPRPPAARPPPRPTEKTKPPLQDHHKPPSQQNIEKNKQHPAPSSEHPKPRPSSSGGRPSHPPQNRQQPAKPTPESAPEYYRPAYVIKTREEYVTIKRKFDDKYKIYQQFFVKLGANRKEFEGLGASWQNAVDPDQKKQVANKIQHLYKERHTKVNEWKKNFKILHEQLKILKEKLKTYVLNQQNKT